MFSKGIHRWVIQKSFNALWHWLCKFLELYWSAGTSKRYSSLFWWWWWRALSNTINLKSPVACVQLGWRLMSTRAVAYHLQAPEDNTPTGREMFHHRINVYRSFTHAVIFFKETNGLKPCLQNSRHSITQFPTAGVMGSAFFPSICHPCKWYTTINKSLIWLMSELFLQVGLM